VSLDPRWTDARFPHTLLRSRKCRRDGTERMAQPDPKQIDKLFSLTYEELKRLALSVKAGDRSPTLNPTALVNEAYARLVDSLAVTPASRLHFKRLAARAMRQILIEAARRRTAAKRGGDEPLLELNDSLDGECAHAEDLLRLKDLFEDLERMSPRQAQLVELRVFGGYRIDEIAELLDVSSSTVEREWRAAKAWLRAELRRD
jgi:RNA polymerase sigma factor (TIGR02999 family)